MLTYNKYTSLEIKGLTYEIVNEDNTLTHILWHEVADIFNNTKFIDGGVFYLTFEEFIDSVTNILDHYRFNTNYVMNGILIMFYYNQIAESSFIKIAQSSIDKITNIPEDVCENVYWGIGYDEALSPNQIKLKIIVGYCG